MPTCGAYIALFVVACVQGYNYTVTVLFINKTDGLKYITCYAYQAN